MGNFTSFAEILEQKIRREIETDYAQDLALTRELQASPVPHSAPFQSLEDTLITLPKMHFQSPRFFTKAYQTSRGPKAVPKPLMPHALNEVQQQAHQFFVKYQEVLSMSFTVQELKKSFRRLALRFHPDREYGSATHFAELKKAHESLVEVFQK